MKRIFLVLLILVSMTGCNKTKEETYAILPFIDKMAIQELEDGWVEYLYIEVDKKNPKSNRVKDNYDMNTISSVVYNVVNLKHLSQGESYIPIENEEGKEIDRVESVVSSHMLTKGKKEDIIALCDFLTAKKFTKPIQEKDLADLKTKTIDKHRIITLYNKALKDEREFVNDKAYTNNKEFFMNQKELDDGSLLRIGYIIAYTGIGYINIEYINSDNEYLSDLCVSEKATKEQKEAQKVIDQIEKEIVKKQNIVVNKTTDYIPDFQNSLQELLDESIKVMDVQE